MNLADSTGQRSGRGRPWAVGNENTGTFPTFRFRPLVEHWDGHAWTLMPVPSPPLTSTGATLASVAATSPRNIWAVGNYATGTRFQPLIEHFNGPTGHSSPRRFRVLHS
jgi:hypothetical protein